MSYDWYIYCDICGARCLASETTKLSHYTGRDGLIVCRHDVDATDHGLMPFTPRREQNVRDIRINHTNTDNGAPVFDYENDTVENISSYIYLANEFDEILTDDDTDNWIAI